MAAESIRDTILRANQRWNAAFNSGDAAAVAALYTSDARVLPHTHDVIEGTGAIEAFWKGLITAGVKNHGIELRGAEASGDLAHADGRWWATLEGENGTQKFEGSLVSVFRRQPDGSWKACLHIWN